MTSVATRAAVDGVGCRGRAAWRFTSLLRRFDVSCSGPLPAPRHTPGSGLGARAAGVTRARLRHAARATAVAAAETAGTRGREESNTRRDVRGRGAAAQAARRQAQAGCRGPRRSICNSARWAALNGSAQPPRRPGCVRFASHRSVGATSRSTAPCARSARRDRPIR